MSRLFIINPLFQHHPDPESFGLIDWFHRCYSLRSHPAYSQLVPLDLQGGQCFVGADNHPRYDHLQLDRAVERAWPIDGDLKLLPGPQRLVGDEAKPMATQVDGRT